MTISRWRRPTWAFLIFNVVMVGLVLAVFGSADAQTSAHGKIGVLLLGMGLVVTTWLIGLLIIAVAWLRNRPSAGALGPPTPSDVLRVAGSDADAVLAEAATTVATMKSRGTSLVEAAWLSRPRSGPHDPLLLNLAFGDPGVHYWALWPDDEDAMEEVLAAVPSMLNAQSR